MSKFENMLRAAEQASKAFDAEANEWIGRVRHQQAQRYEMLFKELLAEHSLGTHKITITHNSPHGAYISQNGERWLDLPRTFDSDTEETLGWIDGQLGGKAWAVLIPDNTLLNQPKDKP